MNDATLVFGLIVAAIGLFIIVNRIKEPDPRFPPITESQFIALLPADIDPQVALKVRRILADALGYPYERIHPHARLMQDLGAM